MYFQLCQCVWFDKNRVNRSHKYMQLQLLLHRCPRQRPSGIPSRGKNDLGSLKTAFALFIRFLEQNTVIWVTCGEFPSSTFSIFLMQYHTTICIYLKFHRNRSSIYFSPDSCTNYSLRLIHVHALPQPSRIEYAE